MADLQVNQITKNYPTRLEPLSVLRDVTFAIGNGESAAILGPSGCGKSTLLQILGTLQRPTSGSMELDGIDPFTLGEAGLASFRNEKVGFIFQDHHLLPQLSALENVLVPAIAKGKPSHEQITRAGQLLASVGLEDRIHHRPSELSVRTSTSCDRSCTHKSPRPFAGGRTDGKSRSNERESSC